MSQDHYTITGVSPRAPLAEILAAQWSFALQHAPRRGGDPEAFSQTMNSFEVLISPSLKAEYDATLAQSGAPYYFRPYSTGSTQIFAEPLLSVNPEPPPFPRHPPMPKLTKPQADQWQFDPKKYGIFYKKPEYIELADIDAVLPLLDKISTYYLDKLYQALEELIQYDNGFAPALTHFACHQAVYQPSRELFGMVLDMYSGAFGQDNMRWLGEVCDRDYFGHGPQAQCALEKIHVAHERCAALREQQPDKKSWWGRFFSPVLG